MKENRIETLVRTFTNEGYLAYTPLALGNRSLHVFCADCGGALRKDKVKQHLKSKVHQEVSKGEQTNIDFIMVGQLPRQTSIKNWTEYAYSYGINSDRLKKQTLKAIRKVPIMTNASQNCQIELSGEEVAQLQ